MNNVFEMLTYVGRGTGVGGGEERVKGVPMIKGHLVSDNVIEKHLFCKTNLN